MATAEVARPVTRSATAAASAAASAAAAPSAAAPGDGSAPLPECGICFDTISTQGHLDTCKHSFCYTCPSCALCLVIVPHVRRVQGVTRVPFLGHTPFRYQDVARRVQHLPHLSAALHQAHEGRGAALLAPHRCFGLACDRVSCGVTCVDSALGT